MSPRGQGHVSLTCVFPTVHSHQPRAGAQWGCVACGLKGYKLNYSLRNGAWSIKKEV